MIKERLDSDGDKLVIGATYRFEMPNVNEVQEGVLVFMKQRGYCLRIRNTLMLLPFNYRKNNTCVYEGLRRA